MSAGTSKLGRLRLLLVAMASFRFCTLDTNFTKSISSWFKVSNIQSLLGEAFLFFLLEEPSEPPRRAGRVCTVLSLLSPGNFCITNSTTRRKNHCNLLPSQPRSCAGRFCWIRKCLPQGTVPGSSMVSSLRQKNTKAQKEDTHTDQKKNHITDRMVSREVAPGALVCPGIWRQDQAGRGPWWHHRGPRPGQDPSGHCDDFRAENKEACGDQLGVGLKGKRWHFQRTIQKEVGSDGMPSPCQCILSEPGALLGGWVHLLFLVFSLLSPDTGEQSRPTDMCPCGVESQRERKILNQRPKTGSHWCVLYGLHCS